MRLRGHGLRRPDDRLRLRNGSAGRRSAPAADHPMDRGDGSSARRACVQCCCRARGRGWTTKGRSVSVSPWGSRSSNDIRVAPSMRRIRREVAVSGNPTVLWRLIREMDGATHGGGDPVQASSERACGGCTNARRAGRDRRHRRVRPTCRPVPPCWRRRRASCRQAAWRATLSCGWRRTGTTVRIRKRPGSPSANRSPIAFARFHALTRSRRSSRDYRGLALGRARFRCAPPHRVRGDRSDCRGRVAK